MSSWIYTYYIIVVKCKKKSHVFSAVVFARSFAYLISSPSRHIYLLLLLWCIMHKYIYTNDPLRQYRICQANKTHQSCRMTSKILSRLCTCLYNIILYTVTRKRRKMSSTAGRLNICSYVWICENIFINYAVVHNLSCVLKLY